MPETTPGGNALKFYASQRLDIRRTATNKDASTGESTSNCARVKVIKNKVAPPFREAELDIEFGTGVSIHAEVLDLAEELKIIDRAGAWYSYNKERIGQGRANAINFLKENDAIFFQLHEIVRTKLFGIEFAANVEPVKEIDDDIIDAEVIDE